jgi:hypothetical protein
MNRLIIIGVLIVALSAALYCLRFFDDLSVEIASFSIENGEASATVRYSNRTAHSIRFSYDIELVRIPRPSRYTWGGTTSVWQEHHGVVVLDAHEKRSEVVKFRLTPLIRNVNAIPANIRIDTSNDKSVSRREPNQQSLQRNAGNRPSCGSALSSAWLI